MDRRDREARSRSHAANAEAGGVRCLVLLIACQRRAGCPPGFQVPQHWLDPRDGGFGNGGSGVSDVETEGVCSGDDISRGGVEGHLRQLDLEGFVS